MADNAQGALAPVSSLSPVEYQGQRVITLAQMDAVHQRASGTAKRTFGAHKAKLIQGEDYFSAPWDEIRTTKAEVGGNRKDVILLTESGYLLLVKSFTDALAWKVQRELVNSYFRQTGSYGQPDAARAERAHALAVLASGQVYQDVLSAAMQQGEAHPLLERWELSFTIGKTDADLQPWVRQCARGTIGLPPDAWMDSLESADGYRMSPEQWQRMLTLAMHHATRGGGLNALCERMVGWIVAENGYPIHLFMPLWQAINRRLEQRMNAPACHANAATFQRSDTPGVLVPADSSKKTALSTPVKRGQLSIQE